MALTQQMILNAEEDLNDLAAIVNGDETTDVATRTGGVVPSLRKKQAQFEDGSTIRADLAAPGGSSLVAHLLPGVGAIPVTLDELLSGLASPVTGYGAVGDGVTDDYAALQAAITAGGPIFFPPGTYAVSATLRAVAAQDLILLGIPGTVTITALGTGIPLLIGNPTAFGAAPGKVHIDGIDFDGGNIRTAFPYATNVGGTYKAVTALQFCADPDIENSSFTLQNSHFQNFPSMPYVIDHFQAVSVSECEFTRTKDPGMRFCANIRWENNHSRYSADNGVSFSRGSKNLVVTNFIAEDCETNGLWISGFPVPGTGSMTLSGASYAAGATLTMQATGGAGFTLADKHTLMTLSDGANTCVVKILSLTDGDTATVGAITAVPAGLQNVASASWTRAPMPGVDSFSLSNVLLIGGYTAGLHCGISPNKGAVSNVTILRSGVIADSEISTTGTIVAGTDDLTVADATDFPVNGWLIVKPRTSLQRYMIAKIIGKAGNVLQLDRNAAETFIDEEVRLAHASSTEGWAVYVTGNGTGITSFAENLDFRGVTAIDYRGNAVQLGSGTLTPVRNLSFNDCTFRDPSNIQRSTAEGVEGIFRIAEPAGSPLANILIRNCRSDFVNAASKYFVRAYVRGTTRRSLVVEDNYTPNVSEAGYLQVLDADNANADITSSYAYSRIDAYGIRSSSADKASQFIALTAAELTDLAATGILKPRANRIAITPTADLVVNSIDWSYLGSTGLSQCHIENGSTTFNVTFTHGDGTIRCPGNANVVLPPRDYVSFAQRSPAVSYKLM